MSEYIAVQSGHFAARGSPGSYQIFKRKTDGTFEVVTDHALLRAAGLEDNYPVEREEAIARAAKLNGGALDLAEENARLREELTRLKTRIGFAAESS